MRRLILAAVASIGFMGVSAAPSAAFHVNPGRPAVYACYDTHEPVTAYSAPSTHSYAYGVIPAGYHVCGRVFGRWVAVTYWGWSLRRELAE